MKHFNLFLVVMIFLMIATEAGASEKMRLSFKEEVLASSASVSLSELIDAKNTSSDIAFTYGHLKITLSENQKSIYPSQILILLGRNGFDLGNVDVKAAEHGIYIRRPNPLAKMIDEKIRSEILSLKKVSSPDADLVIKSDAQNFPDFSNDVSIHTEIQDLGNNRFSVPVSLRKNGSVVATMNYNVSIEVKKNVVVAKRAIQVGEGVMAQDFTEEKRIVDDESYYFTTIGDLGKTQWTIRESMSPGTPLKKNALDTRLLIQKGAVVTLLSGDKRFKVRTVGRVKEVLENGKSVLVENVDSKKELLGKPLNQTEVEIVY